MLSKKKDAMNTTISRQAIAPASQIAARLAPLLSPWEAIPGSAIRTNVGAQNANGRGVIPHFIRLSVILRAALLDRPLTARDHPIHISFAVGTLPTSTRTLNEKAHGAEFRRIFPQLARLAPRCAQNGRAQSKRSHLPR